jgi:hypothetical protein
MPATEAPVADMLAARHMLSFGADSVQEKRPKFFIPAFALY